MTPYQLNCTWRYDIDGETAELVDDQDFTIGIIIGVGLQKAESSEKLAQRLVLDHQRAIEYEHALRQIIAVPAQNAGLEARRIAMQALGIN